MEVREIQSHQVIMTGSVQMLNHALKFCGSPDNMMESKFPVLIVEDETISRRILTNLLTAAGYAVSYANNGREALQILENQYYPLIITDWLMPEVDGLELCRTIRKSKFPGYVFIIMLTTKSAKEDIITGLGSGADDFLVKPVNQAELIARLNTGERVLSLERSLKKVTEEVRLLSITDTLTHCYNRGYLSEQLPGEIKRARRYGHPLSILLLDIDHFKKVNDTYGHMVGDQVLKNFCSTIQSGIRGQVDWIARYGGEEFVVVLPETGIEGARILAGRLKEKIEKMVTEINDGTLRVTFSYGGVSCEFNSASVPYGVSYEAILKQADDMLYEAKNNGRNRGAVEMFFFAPAPA